MISKIAPALLMFIIVLAYTLAPIPAYALPGITPVAFDIPGGDDEPPDYPADAQPRYLLLPVGGSGGWLYELAQEMDIIPFLFDQIGVEVGILSSELLALELEPDDIFQVVAARDDPTPNGVYVGFYLNGERTVIRFNEPFQVRVQIDGAHEDLVSVGPDGNAARSRFDPASGTMVLYLTREGEYIFLLDEDLSTRPPVTVHDIMGDSAEGDGSSSFANSDSWLRLLGDFFLVVVIAVLLSVAIRVIINRTRRR